MTRALGLALIVLAGCPRPTTGSMGAAADGRSSGTSSSACPAWGGRGFSLVVRAQSSHALFFREFAYNDTTGEVRVHDSDLFAAADGSESREPRVIQRSLVLDAADRDTLARELFAMCPDERELSSQEAPGGGTVLRITSPSGAVSTAHYAQGSPADVARRTHARFVRYFPELRRQ